MAIAPRSTYEERVEESSKVISGKSIAVIWSFKDPIHPQVCVRFVFYFRSLI